MNVNKQGYIEWVEYCMLQEFQRIEFVIYWGDLGGYLCLKDISWVFKGLNVFCIFALYFNFSVYINFGFDLMQLKFWFFKGRV